MKTKQKSKISRIIRKTLVYTWLTIGAILSIWTIGFFVYTSKSRELGEVILSVILFAVGLKLLFVYVILSIVIIISYFLMKLLINKKTK